MLRHLPPASIFLLLAITSTSSIVLAARNWTKVANSGDGAIEVFVAADSFNVDVEAQAIASNSLEEQLHKFVCPPEQVAWQSREKL